MLPQTLLFDIDTSEIARLQAQLSATSDQVAAAYDRAMKRTAVTMKSRSLALMRDGMDARSLKAIRKRIHTYRSSFGIRKAGQGMGELKLWFGLNDISLSALKGRYSRIGTRSNPAGAAFTSGALGRQDHHDGFIARVNNRRSIYGRKGRSRWPVREKKAAIYDSLHAEIEDDIFAELPEVFMQHFTTDLKGRVAANDLIRTRQHSWMKHV
ncbi:hypothetical protein [Pseudoalteromonas rubra]|uniref:hypothetical protein n=1 Tax=Pseudoalteromonas rubra TaxID=43658 RepID=UPI000F781DAC|nr:hypothetical protein [Pseudoalteromonas rubra]